MSKVIHSMYGIVMKEYETNGEWSYVVVYPLNDGRVTETFHGETAYMDAERLWFDHVLPITHGGKYA